jgi:hypothetical protein
MASNERIKERIGLCLRNTMETGNLEELVIAGSVILK